MRDLGVLDVRLIYFDVDADERMERRGRQAV